MRRTKKKKKHKVGGITVRSGLEVKVIEDARQYTWLDYEPIVIEWVPKSRKYVPDIRLPNGIIIEIKGRFTSQDRAKHRAVKEQHPDIDIRFVLERNRPLYKGAKSTYGDWLDRMGIPWAVKRIPKEWIDE